MGYATKDSTMTIGRGMFDLPKDKIDMIPGAVILFSERAEILSRNIQSAQDLTRLIFPRQGQTNITDGIESAVNYIMSIHKDPTLHYIITFLSDGGHNYGPQLDSTRISYLRQEIDKKNINLLYLHVNLIIIIWSNLWKRIHLTCNNTEYKIQLFIQIN
jgi:hypothetical protein